MSVPKAWKAEAFRAATKEMCTRAGPRQALVLHRVLLGGGRVVGYRAFSCCVSQRRVFAAFNSVTGSGPHGTTLWVRQYVVNGCASSDPYLPFRLKIPSLFVVIAFNSAVPWTRFVSGPIDRVGIVHNCKCLTTGYTLCGNTNSVVKYLDNPGVCKLEIQ